MKKIVIGSMAGPMGVLARMLGGGYNNTSLPRKDRPTDSSHWHNINDPEQRKRLQAAEAKREDKGAWLVMNTDYAIKRNKAHHELCGYQNGHPVFAPVKRLNPFYVNRGEVI